jgi:hypothetical protein
MSDNMLAVPTCNIMDQKQARNHTQVVSPVDGDGRSVRARGNDLITRPPPFAGHQADRRNVAG